MHRTITHSPFIPFIVLFCHVIESSDSSDLEHMKRLVETLQSTTESRAHNTCDRQRRLFKSLYDVAEKYVEIKSRRDGGRGAMPWPQHHANSLTGSTLNNLDMEPMHSGGGVRDQGMRGFASAYGAIPSQDEATGGDMGIVDGLDEPKTLQNMAFGDEDMEMDPFGAQLWDWFNKNQSMMRLLEDV